MKSWKPALTILCCLFAVKGALADSSNCLTCNMKPYDIPAEEFFPKLRQLVPRVWNQSIALSPLGRRFVDFIKALASHNLPFFASQGIQITALINKFIPYLNQQPDACAMAAVLNATVPCFINRSSTLLVEALPILQDAMINDFNPLVQRTMAHSAGCDFRCGEYPPDPKVGNGTRCYMNGLAYPIKTIWGLPRYRSSLLKDYVFQMYDSGDFNDQFFAICSTFALLINPFELQYFNIGIEAIELSLPSPVQPKCCYQRLQRAEEIRKINDAAAIAYIETANRVFVNFLCV